MRTRSRPGGFLGSRKAAQLGTCNCAHKVLIAVRKTPKDAWIECSASPRSRSAFQVRTIQRPSSWWMSIPSQ